MSEKIPRITAEKAISMIEKIGFKLVRQSGSHRLYRNEEGSRITIPFHSGKILHPKIVKSILRNANLSIEKFRELL